MKWLKEISEAFHLECSSVINLVQFLSSRGFRSPWKDRKARPQSYTGHPLLSYSTPDLPLQHRQGQSVRKVSSWPACWQALAPRVSLLLVEGEDAELAIYEICHIGCDGADPSSDILRRLRQGSESGDRICTELVGEIQADAGYKSNTDITKKISQVQKPIKRK